MGFNPKGLLIFTDNGRYSSNIVRADVPKFAAKNRLQGMPDENKAAVHGGIGTFGTYMLAKKLKPFVALSSGELKCLADLQSNPLNVKRGQQLTQEGQTGHSLLPVMITGTDVRFWHTAESWRVRQGESASGG